MKKFLILFLLFFMTGCTVVRIDTSDIDNTISVILSKENKLYNQVGKGYKYYIPRGVSYIDTDELNDKLYSEGYYYYLYVDAVSYYYKVDINYTEKQDAYYSKKIDNNGKKGYLQIDEYNGAYLIQFVYNYAKIETIVAKEDINNAVLNCSYILSTIKFNNNVVKLMLDENYLINKEESYDLFKPNTIIDDQVEDDNQNMIVDDIGEAEENEEKEEVE